MKLTQKQFDRIVKEEVDRFFTKLNENDQSKERSRPKPPPRKKRSEIGMKSLLHKSNDEPSNDEDGEEFSMRSLAHESRRTPDDPWGLLGGNDDDAQVVESSSTGMRLECPECMHEVEVEVSPDVPCFNCGHKGFDASFDDEGYPRGGDEREWDDPMMGGKDRFDEPFDFEDH